MSDQVIELTIPQIHCGCTQDFDIVINGKSLVKGTDNIRAVGICFLVGEFPSVTITEMPHPIRVDPGTGEIILELRAVEIFNQGE